MTSKGAWRDMFRRRYLPQLIITIALPIFNQFDGINSIMFYAPQLFDAMGQGASQALLTHVIIGAVNVGTTLVAVFTVDRCVDRGARWLAVRFGCCDCACSHLPVLCVAVLIIYQQRRILLRNTRPHQTPTPTTHRRSLGRKFWLVEASFQMMLAEIAMTSVIKTQMSPTGDLPPHVVIALLVVVCIFIAGHAWGWGPMVRLRFWRVGRLVGYRRSGFGSGG